jgi:hypothetical protein
MTNDKQAPLRSAIGRLEYWNGGKMGLKEFFTIRNDFFRFLIPLFHYSIIPSFHVGSTNCLE